MLQQITLALLSLAACLPSVAAAYHSPIDIIRRGAAHSAQFDRRDTATSKKHDDPFKKFAYYNAATAPFWVNGTAIPEVDFDVGESYAGLMPISTKKDESRKLWFWFFPTTGPVKDEIVVWLNGGPGCSSLEGLLQENGPFLWKWGTFKPVPNPYAWTNLTNMIWVEQPVGTGFSQGKPNAKSEEDVAEQFLGFFQNFIETFGLQNKKIYVTGESYAGAYVPYIVDAMHTKNDKAHFDARGLMIYDPVLTGDVVGQQVPVAKFVDYWAPLFGLDASTMDSLHKKAASCGYTSYFEKNLVYPPKGPFPAPPKMTSGCDVWSLVFDAVLLKNPCFSVYEITTTCPMLWDVLGFPGSFAYLPEGASIYFNRTDVQKAINAPLMDWEECSTDDVFPGGDSSDPSSWSVLPRAIDKNERTVIGHGLLDFILMTNGTLLAIQNMTWGGKQGFQKPPIEPFVVPYEKQGIMGVTHTERKLTYVEVELSGHMVPQFQPGAGYRHLEYLLGRIPSL